MLIVECGRDHAPERRYVLDVLLREFLGLDYDLRLADDLRDVTIESDAGDGRKLVVADVLFSANETLVRHGALPDAPFAACPAGLVAGALVEGDLPVLYAPPSTNGAYVDVQPERIEIRLDLFGGAFTMLTRLEEAVDGTRDAHGRYPAAASLAVKGGFARRPLVDEYVEVLWWALRRLWPGLERQPSRFEIRPTHDVDWPFYSRGRPVETLRDVAVDVFARRNRSLAWSRLRSLATVVRSGRAAEPCNTFEFLMSTSEERSLHSAFYFMGGGTDARYDAGYPYDGWMAELLRDIHRRGHEIGVHPSYRTYLDQDALRREVSTIVDVCRAAKIPAPVRGGRQHFLRWANPATWRNWDDVELAYDSTLGYAELSGFRCGTSRAFPVFDLERRAELRLVEQPLVAMETAILAYEDKPLDALVDEMHELKNLCRRFGGMFTFLWHNNRLTTAAEREAYASVLD